ncbi:MAG TPA: tetratricopeptide repeat protein [Pyrinomonadaceae bacterium]|nr:tetratricopeptide repeat protein [Pyrinomonadaceae bacterium]
MSVRQRRRALRAASGFSFPRAASYFALASALLCAAGGEAGAQNTRTELVRHFTVGGQVSLPDDRPAARVRVRITGRGAINRETVTNDNGRYEFTELPAGVYTLSAQSLADESLASGTADADTSRTATGQLTVNLSLRTAPAAAGGRRPSVVSVSEIEQKVPPEARKAFKRGLKLKGEGRADEALASFTRAIELHPEYFQALAERGNLRAARRELGEAASDFGRALELNAHYEAALRGAGYCKLEAREFAQAAEFFERAAAVEPLNAGTHLLLGVAHLELGRRDEARRSLRRALEIDPKGAVRAHVHLANLLASERRYEEAADELRLYLDAVILDPELDEMRKVEARWRALAKGK